MITSNNGTIEEGWDADTLTSYFEDIVRETGAGKLNQNDRAFEVLIHTLLGINKQLEIMNRHVGEIAPSIENQSCL